MLEFVIEVEIVTLLKVIFPNILDPILATEGNPNAPEYTAPLI